MSSVLDHFDPRSHIYAYWLRPEAALWDTIAARAIGDQLRGKKDIVEIGIGNGYFSFLMLGGRFKPEFDWFYSTDTSGFWDNKDIFDHDSGLEIGKFVQKAPATRVMLGIDHKRHLLDQAGRLGFVDRLVEHDCNLPLPVQSCRTVYSNILYWLADPLKAIDEISAKLPKGGELIAVFPNSDFFRACESYVKSDSLWKLLNRGRASHIMWHMDMADFERELGRRGVFEIQFATRYLAPLVLKIWDIGLRPLSVPLIKMANSLSPEKRLEIKHEWCETVEKFAEPLLNVELESGRQHGGFNLVRLVRK